jgi:hypothetical protein
VDGLLLVFVEYEYGMHDSVYIFSSCTGAGCYYKPKAAIDFIQTFHAFFSLFSLLLDMAHSDLWASRFIRLYPVWPNLPKSHWVI